MEKRLKPCPWNEASDRLKVALADYHTEAQEEVKAGRESCFKVDDTFLLLRSETLENVGRELVVVGLDGDMKVGTLCALDYAKQHSFNTVRAHFFRCGAFRYLSNNLSLPVEQVEQRGEERILRIRLTNMGGRSSSKSSTVSSNNSGSVASGGDNNGVQVSGLTNTNLNLTMTDHGAIEEALNFGGDVIASNNNALQGALASNNNALESALKFGGNAFDTAIGFGSNALEENADLSQYAMDTISSMAHQQAETTKSALAMANSVKAREQTGTNESDNSALKTISIVVGIAGTLITTAYLIANKGK